MKYTSQNKLLLDQLRIEKLGYKHLPLLHGFNSSNLELTMFLQEDAYNNQELSISTSYLWFYNPNNKLVAYISILNDALRVHGTRLGKSFTDIGVSYKTLPALKIGRMSVDKEQVNKGLGTFMIHFVMKKLLISNEKCSCRFITVDSKPESVKFYKKMGFDVLKGKDKGTLPMYYDMYKLIKLFREKKFNLFKLPEEN